MTTDDDRIIDPAPHIPLSPGELMAALMLRDKAAKDPALADMLAEDLATTAMRLRMIVYAKGGRLRVKH